MTKFVNKYDNSNYQETGLIKVHNYPASYMTYSYITKIYRKHTDNGWIEVDGEPHYFNDLKPELLTLAIIIGEAQNTLHSKLPLEKSLIAK